jgi:hypothetical protein
VSIGLDFLGLSRFCRQNLTSDVLDFLGFSRPDRAFSMGYVEKASKKFSSPFVRSDGHRNGIDSRGCAQAQSCSWGQLNLLSAFPQ